MTDTVAARVSAQPFFATLTDTQRAAYAHYEYLLDQRSKLRQQVVRLNDGEKSWKTCLGFH